MINLNLIINLIIAIFIYEWIIKIVATAIYQASSDYYKSKFKEFKKNENSFKDKQDEVIKQAIFNKPISQEAKDKYLASIKADWETPKISDRWNVKEDQEPIKTFRIDTDLTFNRSGFGYEVKIYTHEQWKYYIRVLKMALDKAGYKYNIPFKENLKTNKSYVALFERYQILNYSLHSTYAEALTKLRSESESELIIDIAIIEISTKEMIWYKGFLGQSECQAKVDKFIKENKEIFKTQ